MKYLLQLSFIALLLIPNTSNAQFGNLINKAKDVVSGESDINLSQDEIGSGLKEALEVGVTGAVEML